MTIFGGGRLVTFDPSRPYMDDGVILVEDGVITRLGPTSELRDLHPDATFVDAGGGVIMPGLINMHHHTYSALARAMPLKGDPPKNFLERLQSLWWHLDKNLTLRDVNMSARATFAECIRNGVTTVFDHHASPGAAAGSLFQIAEAAGDLGLRASLCYEVSDRCGEEVSIAGIKENVDFIRHCRHGGDGKLHAMFGLHASFTLSNKTLERCVYQNTGAGYHIHVAEGPTDQTYSRQNHGKPVVERLCDMGIFGPDSLAVHCIDVGNDEIELLKDSGASVVHNPESNMSNAVGCAPVIDMMSSGVNVALGTDGFTSDMLESLKTSNCFLKQSAGSPSAGLTEPCKMLFETNAALASNAFGAKLGVLTEGAAGDIAVFEYDPITPMNASNYRSHILFGMTGRQARHVAVAGRLLLKDGELLTADTKEIAAKAREAAAELWSRL